MDVSALLWVLPVAILVYGILFLFALSLSRGSVDSRQRFRALSALAYGLVMIPALYVVLNTVDSAFVATVIGYGIYLLLNLLILPSSYRMATASQRLRGAPMSDFAAYSSVVLGARLVLSAPFFLTFAAVNEISDLTAQTSLGGFYPSLLIAFSVAFLISLSLPHVLAALFGPPDPTLTRVARDLAQKADMRPPKVILLPTRDAYIANAFVAAPFNRYVFVTDYLYQESGPQLTSATIAHELGHRFKRHIPLILLLLPLWSVVSYYALGAGIFVLILGFLVLFALMRRNEFAADRFAADLVGQDVMVQNLLFLTRFTGEKEEEARSTGPFATHPGTWERIRRLMGPDAPPPAPR